MKLRSISQYGVAGWQLRHAGTTVPQKKEPGLSNPSNSLRPIVLISLPAPVTLKFSYLLPFLNGV